MKVRMYNVGFETASVSGTKEESAGRFRNK